MANWTWVKDFVKSEFREYLPVPDMADVTGYQPLKFLMLPSEPRWYEKPLRLLSKTPPIFGSVGEIDNFASLRPLEVSSPIPLPKIRKEKLFIHGEDATIKTTLEGRIKKSPVECAEGSMKTCTVSPSLGVISRYNVSYRDLRTWIEQYCFLVSAEDMRQEAKKGNLFVIHDVIMAEQRQGKGKHKQSISGHISSILKLNYESKSSLYLCRPSEYGPFPIAFKIGQVKARRPKHAAHGAMTNRTAGSDSSSSSTTTGTIYRLKLEPLRDFCKSSSKRKFDKENSPSSDDSLSPSSSRSPKRGREDGSRSNEAKARKCLAKILGVKEDKMNMSSELLGSDSGPGIATTA